MPIYAEVEGVGRLEFPDGTDPGVIQATVKKVTASGDQARLDTATASWRKNNPIAQLGNVARGSVDVIGGGAQLLSRGANALGLVPESNPGGFFAGPKDVEAQNAQARQNIDNVFGKEAPGFNPVRAGSAGLLTMPLTPTGFLQAPTMLGRAGGAAVGGGIAGAVQEVPNPQSNADFFKKKGLQTVVGAGSAALAQPIAEKVVGAVVAGLNAGGDKALAFMKNATGANELEKIVGMTRAALKAQGIDYDAMSDQAKSGLLNDVQQALQSYSGISGPAVARQAAFRQEGFDPVRHWITRDPAEFTKIENLSHTEAGAPIGQKKNDLDAFAMKRLIGMRGEQRLPEDVGKAAIGDLSAYLGQQNGKTNVLYDTFRNIAPDVKGNPQRFVNDVFGGLEGKMALGSLPDGVKNILNSISQGETPLTPSTLFQLQKMLKPGADGNANFALGHLSKAIDREMEAISSSLGQPASQEARAWADDMTRRLLPDATETPPAFNPDSRYTADVLKMARGQAKSTFDALDESKILRGVDEKTLAPENFGDILFRASNKELVTTWGKLNPDTKQEVRAQVLDMLKTKAFGGASENSGKSANQATFNNFISDPTTAQKLKIILGDDQFQAVKRLGLMLESAHMQPSGSTVNNSHTGGALITALPRVAEMMKAGNIPGNSLASSMANKGIVQNAQYVPGEALGQRSPMIDPYVEEILKRRTGHYSGLLGGAAGFPALQGLLAP